MSEKQTFTLCVLTLLVLVLLFSCILTSNILRERNLALNEHVLQNCNIQKTEVITEYKRP